MQLIAFALALAAQAFPWVPPGTHSVVSVEALIRPEDCGPARCDWSPALERAQQSLDDVGAPQFAVSAPGGTIQLPCGVGDLSQPIVLRRGHTIRGCGGTFPSCATLLNVATSTHAIVARRVAAGFVLRDLCIITPVAAEKIDRHAVLVGGRGEIDEVSIRGGFVDGLHIRGDVRESTNVNGLRVRGGRIDLVERSAVWLEGQDANANTFDSIDIGASCQRGSRWAQPIGATESWSISGGIITLKLPVPAAVKAGYFLAFDTPTSAGRLKQGGQVLAATPSGAATTIQIRHPGAAGSAIESGALTQPCANVVDLAFLNNTWIAVQTAQALDRVTGERFRSFIFGNPAARTVCLGCYSENDQLPGWVSAQGTVLGGIGAWEGPGFRLEGRRASGLIVPGVASAGDTLPPEVWLGGDIPGTVLSLRPPQAGSAVSSNGVLRWRLDAPKKSWRFDVAGADAAIWQRVSVDPGRYGVTAIKTSTRTYP